MATEPAPEGRAGYVLSQLYYYVVAVIGVGLLIGGGIATLLGVRTLVLPEEFEQARDGVRGILHGIAFLLPGAALLWWHLREARRREGRPFRTAFWGASLYYHLVALVALVFVLVGTTGVLHSAVDAAVPSCPGFEERFAPPQPIPVPEEGFGEEPPPPPAGEAVPETARLTSSDCYPSPGDAGRQAVNFGIVLVVAGPVFWWHLRQGRRLTSPSEPAEESS